MAELRKDYFINRFVILSKERSRRPSEFKISKKDEEQREECPFCPGNELMTPPADFVLVQSNDSLVKLCDEEDEPVKNWCIRAFPNKYPAVTINAQPIFSDSPLYSEPAYGYHYIIVVTPEHNQSFSRLSLSQWVNVFVALQDKVRWLYSQKGVSYVAIFINQGKNAGASQSHSHIQLITLPKLPPIIEQEVNAVQKSVNELGACPMCRVVSLETGGPRQILSTDFYTAFTPWAPSHPFEFWIFPKKHQTSFLKSTQKEITDLALILRSTLGGLSKALNEPDFNLVFHVSSEKKMTKQIHWHIEVYPRLSNYAGLEKGMGVYIVEALPEETAEVLGAMSRKELAKLMGIT